ncbi:MAG: hypothetical protein ABIV43_01585 [Candidatus Saccharimonadales bacterium]
MKHFQSTRLVHKPVTLIGFAVYVLALIFLATVVVAIDRDSHSVSDTVYGAFPYFASTFLLVEWIASKTCEKS